MPVFQPFSSPSFTAIPQTQRTYPPPPWLATLVTARSSLLPNSTTMRTTPSLHKTDLTTSHTTSTDRLSTTESDTLTELSPIVYDDDIDVESWNFPSATEVFDRTIDSLGQENGTVYAEQYVHTQADWSTSTPRAKQSFLFHNKGHHVTNYQETAVVLGIIISGVLVMTAAGAVVWCVVVRRWRRFQQEDDERELAAYFYQATS